MILFKVYVFCLENNYGKSLAKYNWNSKITKPNLRSCMAELIQLKSKLCTTENISSLINLSPSKKKKKNYIIAMDKTVECFLLCTHLLYECKR